jgi:hypothetical protein
MRLLDNTVDSPALPSWLTDADLDYYAAEFRRTGFRGGLNWYRNITRSWQLLAPWRGVIIHQPSLFIAGARDDVLKFPSSRPQVLSVRVRRISTGVQFGNSGLNVIKLGVEYPDCPQI